MADRSVLVRLRANADQFVREMRRASTAVRGVRDQIDTSNDRTAWMVQGLLALAPAAVTAGATAIPVLMGIATQAAVGATAIGTVALAFNGIGDALKALNKYELEPTAKNLQALQEEMARLGPDGAQFVGVLDQVGEKLSILQMDARAGMFPGMTEGLEDIVGMLPQLRAVVTAMSEGVGTLSADAGAGLAGPEFEQFFDFLTTDGKQILIEAGRTLGNFIDGFASLMVAFGPLTREYSAGLLDMSRRFEEWSEGLDRTDGFRAFVQYVEDNAPAVREMFGSIGTALVEVAKAAAPVGEIMVPALEALADAISIVADTPMGSFLILGVAITSLAGRLMALRRIAGGPIFAPFTRSIRDSVTATRAASGSVTAMARAFGPAAASVGLLAVAMSPLPEKVGLTNATMGAMIGMMAGPWGAAVGAGVGGFMDLTAAAHANSDSLRTALSALYDLENVDPAVALEKSISALEDLRADVEKVNFGEWLFGDDGKGTEIEQQALADLEESIDKLRVAKSKAADEKAFAEQVKKDADAAQESVEAFRNLAQAYEAPELTLSQLLERMREWGRAAGDMGKNIRRALNAGANPEALNDIIERLGPAAGVALQELADAGVGGAKRLNGSWRTFQNRLGTLNGAITDVKDDLREIGLESAVPYVDLMTGDYERKKSSVEGGISALNDKKAKPKVDLEKSKFDATMSTLNGALNRTGNRRVEPRVSLLGVPGAEAQLQGLTRSRTVTVNVAMGSSTAAMEQRLNRKGSADGSTVPKDGGPYRDRYPYLLAPGEEVISNRHGQADRHRPLLKAINAGMLADGGTAGGLAGGGSVPALPFAGLPSLNLTTMQLGQLNKALAASRRAVDRERSEREELISASSTLRETVRDRNRSELFGGDEWSSGGGIEGAIGILRGDAAAAALLKKQIKTLNRKGLNGAALDALLSEADAGTVASFAAGSAKDLRRYEAAFERRALLTASSGSTAAAAAYGSEIAAVTAQTRTLEARLKRIELAIRQEHKSDRRSQRNGSRAAARAGHRGQVKT